MQSKNRFLFFLICIYCCVDLFKEYYIVESGFSTDGAIEINDDMRGPIYIKELTSSENENDELSVTGEQEPELGMLVAKLFR